MQETITTTMKLSTHTPRAGMLSTGAHHPWRIASRPLCAAALKLASLTFKRTSSEEEISYALVYTQPPPLTPALKRSPVPEMTATRPRARAHSFTGSAIEDNFAKPAPVFRRRSASFSSRGAIDVDTWRPTPGLSRTAFLFRDLQFSWFSANQGPHRSTLGLSARNILRCTPSLSMAA